MEQIELGELMMDRIALLAVIPIIMYVLEVMLLVVLQIIYIGLLEYLIMK